MKRIDVMSLAFGLGLGVVITIGFDGRYASKSPTAPATVAVAPADSKTEEMPKMIDEHRWVGRFDMKIGDTSFDIKEYAVTDVDKKGNAREMFPLAVIYMGKGMEVNGRWDESKWWVEAHDAAHQFPDSIRIPVTKVDPPPFTYELLHPVGVSK